MAGQLDNRPADMPGPVNEHITNLFRQRQQTRARGYIVMRLWAGGRHILACGVMQAVAIFLCGKFGQCGLIGSETKATRFRNRLEKNGISSDQINRLVCPVGLQQVAGKAPLQVALSITAQLSNWLEDRI